MRGRALLATVAGATVTLPGCFGDGPDDSGSPTTPTRPTTDDRAPTDSSADDATSSATPAGDPDVTVESVVLQHGSATPTSPDSIGVTDADQAYLVVDVAVDGSLAREDLVLEIPDRTYTPETDLRLYRTEWGSETDYADGRNRGLVVFAPGLAGEGVDVRIAWPGGARSVEGDVRIAWPGGADDVRGARDGDGARGHGGPAGRDRGDERVGPPGPLPRRAQSRRPQGGLRPDRAGVRPLRRRRDADADRRGQLERAAGGRLGDGPEVTYHLDYADGEDAVDIDVVRE